jgi:hypothetical protein
MSVVRRRARAPRAVVRNVPVNALSHPGYSRHVQQRKHGPGDRQDPRERSIPFKTESHMPSIVHDVDIDEAGVLRELRVPRADSIPVAGHVEELDAAEHVQALQSANDSRAQAAAAVVQHGAGRPANVPVPRPGRFHGDEH